MNQKVIQKLQFLGIEVREGRGTWKAKCPKCHAQRKNQRDKSLSVTVVSFDKAAYKCHNCGWGGYSDSIDRSRKEYKPVEPKGLTPEERVFDYFAKRGIPREVVERNRITYDRQDGYHNGRICFNYFENGELMNIKFRTGDKKFFQVAQAKKIFYKLDDARDQKQVIITEGEIDALSFEAAGMPWAISVPDGAPAPNAQVTEAKFEYLDNCYQVLEAAEVIYIATDTDAPGVRLREELGRRLGAERCRIVRYPSGLKDANDVLVTEGFGTEALKMAIETAEPFPISGVTTGLDYLDQVLEVHECGWPEGKILGYGQLDKCLPLHPGFWVITGIPGHGKTTFLDQYLQAHAVVNGVRTAVYSPENPPLESIVPAIERLLGKPITKRADEVPAAEVEMAMSFVDDHIFYIMPEGDGHSDQNGLSVDEILEQAKKLIRAKGIKVLVIDPWNTIEHSILPGENKNDYISRSLGKLSLFSKRYDVTVILVAHPTKMNNNTFVPNKQEKESMNLYRRPSLYDISDSAHFYNKADVGICVYRDYDNDITEVNIQKMKFDWKGQTGRVKLLYQPQSKRFISDEEGYYPATWVPSDKYLNQSEQPQEVEVEDVRMSFLMPKTEEPEVRKVVLKVQEIEFEGDFLAPF
jgi:twinkle protein